jgi:hypothetical protein
MVMEGANIAVFFFALYLSFSLSVSLSPLIAGFGPVSTKLIVFPDLGVPEI